jgi:signal transduction histidine kinase
MSRNLLRRIDAINRGSAAILRGDLQRRMPVTGSGDEFDQLSANLNRMLDQIEHLMTGMRGVADDIAHDLRGPISRLRSRLEVTLLEDHDLETYKSALQETVAETEAILATFNAILNISLAESGALRDAFEEIDLDSLIRDVADLYAPLAEERGSQLAVEAEPGIFLRGHRPLLSQALANLLDNAVKHAAGSGPITLSTRRHDGGIEIGVADRGPGIPADFRDRALERFVRGEVSRSTPGSGLGLALVAAVAHLHEARLELRDNGPGLKAVLRWSALPAA